ncbi:headcase protein [Drosophila sechellia]|uniref:GM12874 n=1 Tax=Drosophila sechellia TaxID=7238 RepID=B4HZP8_DROSE|nr:headcase protein [Drosophila sechellia]EDW53505.1 GM12874 [Drosophila sechellia]
MAPRRNSNISSSGNSTQQQHQQQLQQQHQTQQLLQFYAENANSSGVLMAPMQGTGGVGGGVVHCCLPSGDCRKLDTLIPLNELSLADCIRVLCNNENCSAGQYMHRECFEWWEASVLQALKANGRARSWSERQRLQHLWTKKGYELVQKACSCKCGRGQLRKDLDWVPPSSQGVIYLNGSGNRANLANGSLSEDDDKKKAKKKRNRNNNNGGGAGNGTAKAPLSNNNGNSYAGLTPNPNVGVIGSGLPHNNGNTTSNGSSGNNGSSGLLQPSVLSTFSNILNQNNVLGLDLRARAGSLSSSGAGSGSTSPSDSRSSGEISVSPVQQLLPQQQQQQQSLLIQPLGPAFGSNLLQNGLGLSKNLLIAPQQQQQNNLPALANISNFKPLASYEQQQLVQQQKNKEVELYSERVRSTSGCNGIFSRRLDFSSFNLLPKTRLNSYQVKIEDEGNHGNDETRLFILSSLAQSQMSRVACILCEEPLLVFDRYPLVDGSFFLSPKQHSSGCIEVKYEGRTLYLTCVCMSCLDGTSSSRAINCRFCKEPWDGSSLVLGTMYAYDIFAAMPCCAERFKCNNCFKMLMHPQQRLSFYSDYSHGVTCPYCNTQDTHFVKPLTFCYAKSTATRLPTLA